MAQTLSQLIVYSDHVTNLDVLGDSVVLTVASGGPVYYADNPQVSAGSNQGSVSAGSSQTFTSHQWLIGTAGSPAMCTLISTVTGGDATSGSGDTLTNQLTVPQTGQALTFAQGTFANPITNVAPVIKANYTQSALSTAVTGDGGEQLAAILGISKGVPASQVQAVGVLGSAINTGTTKGSSDSPDACGIYGFGRVGGASAIGVGIGVFGRGQADVSGAHLTAAQFLNYNNTGSNFTPNTTGFSGGVCLLITDGGPNSSACGIEFDNGLGQQFHTGIHANAHVLNSLTGGISTNTFFDECNSTNSINISGTHTYAMLVQSGAGKVVIGNSTGAFGSALLEIRQPTVTTDDPLVVISGDNASANTSLSVRNGTGSIKLFAAGAAGALITGTNAGDTGLQAVTSGKRMVFGGSTIVVSVTNANTLGFFAVTEVAQQNAVGTATGYAAGATAVTFHSDDTYTGNTGSTAYTINGIVSALKKYGLLAS